MWKPQPLPSSVCGGALCVAGGGIKSSNHSRGRHFRAESLSGTVDIHI